MTYLLHQNAEAIRRPFLEAVHVPGLRLLLEVWIHLSPPISVVHLNVIAVIKDATLDNHVSDQGCYIRGAMFNLMSRRLLLDWVA